jgi:hypothetical protein
MRRQALMLCVLLLAAGVGCVTLARNARIPRVIGVVEEPKSGLLRITTTSREIREIRIDHETRYTKWLTHQPWTVDKFVDAKSLMVGHCVNIVLRTDDFRVARLVEVNLDRPGTFQDPCLSLR